ncbi:PAS domain-containing hybrid sensor histidine kinase/response regulator [Bdellovibrio sp. NC01]|uniref:PAS domain-containing hybrid sensor histidine kinase/response regulator n=1 Tax=Bdellovibrio sp. NC01 TaxID=2220073 RepID=UPI001157EF72|nr:PAS domain-containing hybrid sensor histidine kinase/response regulator [Bdellovibrio sp. NC01]QDK39267.1 hybrid sensor histidine kinase/response regulator [Bdellovibrio sp. NC01]
MNDSFYEALLNTHALIELSVDGHILWANRNYLNLMGYELHEIIGKPHSIFLPHFDSHESEYREMWRSLAMGQSQTGEFSRVTKNKNIVWVQASYAPIKDSNGRIQKILKMAVDITEKKRLAENLERKNRELQTSATKARAATYAKSAFLANMSHEIRTPLNSIIGLTDTLAETKLDEQQASYVEILQRANHQLMTIINDILDLTKVESGEIQLHVMPFDIQNVFDDVISVLGFRAKEKGLQLKLKMEEGLESYYIGDADRLRQVLINLLSNALKFTHQGDVTLHVSRNTTSRPGNLLFSVSDSGIGIPRHMFKDIFRAFTQGDAATTRRYGGTGLGLSISQKMVELMNGQIWLESELGKGSIFFFTAQMPICSELAVRANNPMQSRLKSAEANSVNATKLKILVVDDVDDNRNLFGIYLQKSAHEIHYAESGIEALRMLEDMQFDIIFMDVQMPGMDGYETTRLIREQERAKNRIPAKIFACTANAFTEDIEKSLQAGCDLHLSKPIRKDTLIKSINSYLPSQFQEPSAEVAY